MLEKKINEANAKTLFEEIVEDTIQNKYVKNLVLKDVRNQICKKSSAERCQK